MTNEPDHQWTKQGYTGEYTFMIVHDLIDGEEAYEAVIIGPIDTIYSETVRSEKDAREVLNIVSKEEGIQRPTLRRLKY